MKLVATKSMTYATRRLTPGDPFEAKTARDGRLLIAVNKARRAPDEAAEEVVDEKIALRAEYERIVGKRPFMGWDADTLRAKMAKADKA